MESKIYRHLLQFYCGRINAVKAKTLADKFNLSLREVNDEIRNLRRQGALIGSSKEFPYGYYIPSGELEINEYMDTFHDELFDMLQTYNIQKRAARKFKDRRRQPEFFAVPSGQFVFIPG